MHKDIGILFDFDDTLVETAIYFETAREQFARLMSENKFPLNEVLATLDRFDIENVKRCGGFLKNCFPDAMRQTYKYYCSIRSKEPDPGVMSEIDKLGRFVFAQKPMVKAGADEVLEILSKDYVLLLITKGDPEVQRRRISESGLENYFTNIYMLRDKTSHTYEKIAGLEKIRPQYSWVVGNSIKADINPGIQAGFNCIFIENQYTWSYEMEEPVGEYLTLDELTQVPGAVKKWCQKKLSK